MGATAGRCADCRPWRLAQPRTRPRRLRGRGRKPTSLTSRFRKSGAREARMAEFIKPRFTVRAAVRRVHGVARSVRGFFSLMAAAFALALMPMSAGAQDFPSQKGVLSVTEVIGG